MKTQQPELITLLKQQQAQLDALLLLLEAELDALVGRDTVRLDQLVTEKSLLLANISHLDQQLAQAPELPQATQATWFRTCVSEIEQKLAACKTQTAVNQKVLEQSQLTLQRFKNEILGAQGKSGLTYTSKGQPAVENKGLGIKA